MSKEPIPYQKIGLMLQEIGDIRTKALVALQYGCAARIGEIIPFRSRTDYLHADGSKPETRQLPGVRKADITTMDYYSFVRLNTLKNQKARQRYSAPIMKSEAKPLGSLLWNSIKEWMDFHDGETLFPVQGRTARKLIKDSIGLSSHYLRHSRLDHLRVVYNYDEFDLMKVAGHSSMRSTMIYLHPRIPNIASRMKQYSAEPEKEDQETISI